MPKQGIGIKQGNAQFQHQKQGSRTRKNLRSFTTTLSGDFYLFSRKGQTESCYSLNASLIVLMYMHVFVTGLRVAK